MPVDIDKAIKAARKLPAQQRAVLTHLSAGLTRKEIADKLGVSMSTVNGHCTVLFRTLGIMNSREAVRVAMGLKK